MRNASLSLRLLLAAGVSTVVALVITAVAISYLFEVYFQKRLLDELRVDLTQLTAALVLQESGDFEIRELGDLRYDQPFGGRYWQVGYGDIPPLLSRSLWDQALNISVTETYGETQSAFVTAPFGAELLALSWRITIDGFDAPGGIVLSVATDLSELNSSSAQFRSNIAVWLALLAGALILAAWLQVRVGLKPLEQIRAELEKVAHDETGQLPDGYPAEVRPLVETINALLEKQAGSLTNARRRASDLAHGLKTPLTILAAHADDIRAEGNFERADQIASQVASMRFFVERELARSRVSPSRQASSDLKKVAAQMVEAIGKLPGADRIDWTVDIPSGLTAPFDAHDLSELLGNLLDNARKYARSKVVLTAIDTGSHVVLRIEDDGPGVPEDELERIKRPGVQGTDSATGYGLGLAIVQDILELQGGELELENHPGKGLVVLLRWDKDREAPKAQGRTP